MKKVIFFVFVFFFFVQNLIKAQPATDTSVYTFVEESASFPGGEEARFKFFCENTIYPSFAKESGIQGKVYVEFIVEIDGSITNAHVVKSVHPSLDSEAVRVIKLMPKWTPAMQGGKTVRQKVVIPVVFKLDDGSDDVVFDKKDIDDFGQEKQEKPALPDFPRSYTTLSLLQFSGFPSNAHLLNLRNRELCFWQSNNIFEKSKHYNIGIGTFWSVMNIHSDIRSWETDTNGNFTNILDTSVVYDKNKAVISYFGIPIDFKVRMGKDLKNAVFMTVGVRGGVRIFASQKFVTGDLTFKTRIPQYFNKYMYGVYGQLGWKYGSVFGTYNLSSVFSNDIMSRPWTIGVGIVF